MSFSQNMDTNSIIMGCQACRQPINNDLVCMRMNCTTSCDNNGSSNLRNVPTAGIWKRMIMSSTVSRNNSPHPEDPSKTQVNSNEDEDFFDKLIDRMKAGMSTKSDENRIPRRTRTYKRKGVFDNESLNLMKRFKDNIRIVNTSPERSTLQNNDTNVSEANSTSSSQKSRAGPPRYRPARENPHSVSSLIDLSYSPMDTGENSKRLLHQNESLDITIEESSSTTHNYKAVHPKYRSVYGNCYHDSSVSYSAKSDATLQRRVQPENGVLPKEPKTKLFAFKFNRRKQLRDASNDNRLSFAEGYRRDRTNKYNGQRLFNVNNKHSRLPPIEEDCKDSAASSPCLESNIACLFPTSERMGSEYETPGGGSYYFMPLAQCESFGDKKNGRSCTNVESPENNRRNRDSAYGTNFEYVISKTEILEITEVNDQSGRTVNERCIW